MSGRPARPSVVPTGLADEAQHRLLIATALNAALRGKLDATLEIALTPGAGATVVSDPRIGPDSAILWTPRTASAAAAAAALYVAARGKGAATLAHASAPATDQRFTLTVIG